MSLSNARARARASSLSDLTLDDLGPKLCSNGVPFHAHRGYTETSKSLGSLWTAGVNGLAIEFHGAFDYSSFDEDAVTQLDYCTSTSDAPTKYNSTTAAADDDDDSMPEWTQQTHTAHNKSQYVIT